MVQDFEATSNPTNILNELAKQEDEEIKKRLKAMNREKEKQNDNRGTGGYRGRGSMQRPTLDQDYIEVCLK